jgi:hypothetical protein
MADLTLCTTQLAGWLNYLADQSDLAARLMHWMAQNKPH